MKIPDLEADIAYQEDLDYLLTRSTYQLDADKLLEFWLELTPEKLREVAARAREYHAKEIMEAEIRERDERRKAIERENIILLGFGRKH